MLVYQRVVHIAFFNIVQLIPYWEQISTFQLYQLFCWSGINSSNIYTNVYRECISMRNSYNFKQLRVTLQQSGRLKSVSCPLRDVTTCICNACRPSCVSEVGLPILEDCHQSINRVVQYLPSGYLRWTSYIPMAHTHSCIQTHARYYIHNSYVPSSQPHDCT